jgi:hypothetical protein
VFYHILVDARDWPGDATQPPVAYVAEECLSAGSSADFTSDQPLVVSETAAAAEQAAEQASRGRRRASQK